MQKVFKRMLSLIVSATMLVTVFSVLSISVSAKGVFDDAVTMEAMTCYSLDNLKSGDFKFFKITLKNSGDLTLRWSCGGGVHAELYDSAADIVEKSFFIGYNEPGEKTISGLKKGTYYLKIFGRESYTAKIDDLYHVFKSDEKPTIKLNVSIYEGSSIKLGAIVSNSDSSVTWLSTKPNVASVSSKGKVKGLKAGKSTIRASLNSGEYVEIRVTVVEKE